MAYEMGRTALIKHLRESGKEFMRLGIEYGGLSKIESDDRLRWEFRRYSQANYERAKATRAELHAVGYYGEF